MSLDVRASIAAFACSLCIALLGGCTAAGPKSAATAVPSSAAASAVTTTSAATELHAAAEPAFRVRVVWFESGENPAAGSLQVNAHGLRFVRDGGDGYGGEYSFWQVQRVTFSPSYDAAQFSGRIRNLWLLFREADGSPVNAETVKDLKARLEAAVGERKDVVFTVEPVANAPWDAAADRPPPRIAIVMSRKPPDIEFTDEKYGSLRNPDSVAAKRAVGGAKSVAEFTGNAAAATGNPAVAILAIGAVLVGGAVGGVAGAVEDVVVKQGAPAIVATAPAFQSAADHGLATGPAPLPTCVARALEAGRIAALPFTYATADLVWRTDETPHASIQAEALRVDGYSHLLLVQRREIVVEHDPDPSAPRSSLSRFRVSAEVKYTIATLDKSYGESTPMNAPASAKYRSDKPASVAEWTANDAQLAKGTFAAGCASLGVQLAASVGRYIIEARPQPAEKRAE